jgi:hydrogenase expression/formation protein HypD
MEPAWIFGWIGCALTSRRLWRLLALPRETVTARQWLARIHRLALPPRVRIMNVCGGHERAISMAGLRGALPANIELIPGPGCPVCVCPEEAIFEAIRIAQSGQATVVAFGDMLRVPANTAKGVARSLEAAKAAGADVRAIASPIDAVRIANEMPTRQVVFFAAGFETTTAPIAGMLAEGIPENLSILLAARLTWPAVAMLLETGAAFDALIAPGHVATVMGSEEWDFVAAKHGIPTAIAGFTAESLLAALYCVLRQVIDGDCRLDNAYPEFVRPGGNVTARQHLSTVLDIVEAPWRGIGNIPASGFALKPAYQAYDALRRFPPDETLRWREGEMPPGCACADVVLGRKTPDKCKLYGTVCTPRAPVGPCMVSDEGACRIWWHSGIRASLRPTVAA